MIKLSSVSFSYGEKIILNDFSLEVRDGECVVLKGPSGCGKTTAAMIVCRLLKPSSGDILSPDKISVVFQEDRFVNNLSLLQNIRLPLSKKDYPIADNLLKRVGLYEDRYKKISELSGGMKRRAAIVRAVAFNGDSLILDEAFNGIDNENKKICADIIKEYFLDKNKPVLFITHNDEDGNLFGAKQILMEKANDE